MLGVIVTLFGLTSVDTLVLDSGIDARDCMPSSLEDAPHSASPVRLNLKSRDELKQLFRRQAISYMGPWVSIALKLDDEWLLVDRSGNAVLGKARGTFDTARWEAIKARSHPHKLPYATVFDVTFKNSSGKSVTIQRSGTPQKITIAPLGTAHVTGVNDTWSVLDRDGNPQPNFTYSYRSFEETRRLISRKVTTGDPRKGLPSHSSVTIDVGVPQS